MVNRLLNPRLLLTVVLMLIVCLSLSSCETLRKKFIRKKKQDTKVSQEFQPILEPEEYIAIESQPIEVYKQHYAMVKVWYKDLWTGVEEQNTDSNVKYSFKQIFEHLDEMKSFLKPEKQERFLKLYKLLKYYQESLNQDRRVRNYAHIQSDLRAFDRLLRNEFKSDVIKDDLISK